VNLKLSYFAVCISAIVLAISTLGCGDDDTAPGSQAGSNGRSNAGASASSSPPTTSECGAGMAPPPAMGNCTAKQIQDYVDCAEASCSSTFKTCYGPNYASGKYGGACQPYVECARACGCENASCVQKCTGANECAQCFTEHPCGTECLPNCNAKPGDKTCDDLALCCATISSAQNKSSCNQIVTQARMLGGSGDVLCNSSYMLFSVSGTCPK
jgi:hypothetical protein